MGQQDKDPTQKPDIQKTRDLLGKFIKLEPSDQNKEPEKKNLPTSGEDNPKSS
jgi:hypothetical protein